MKQILRRILATIFIFCISIQASFSEKADKNTIGIFGMPVQKITKYLAESTHDTHDGHSSNRLGKILDQGVSEGPSNASRTAHFEIEDGKNGKVKKSTQKLAPRNSNDGESFFDKIKNFVKFVRGDLNGRRPKLEGEKGWLPGSISRTTYTSVTEPTTELTSPISVVQPREDNSSEELAPTEPTEDEKGEMAQNEAIEDAKASEMAATDPTEIEQ